MRGWREARRWGTGLVSCVGLVACAVPLETTRDAYLAPQALAPERPSGTWEPRTDADAPGVLSRDDLAPRADLAEDDTHDLAGLIDLALRTNPQTRESWEVARARAAAFGASMGDYLPDLGVEARAGYAKYLFESPGSPAAIKQYAVTPLVNLEWILFDFGRREAGVEIARRRLLAANFDFNRALQDVIFSVQTAYFALDAAHGMVGAAERNMTTARAVTEASDERLARGLATKPDALLARQTEAKAAYDLEAARVLVSDSEATLALALGVPADQPIRIEPIEDVPPGLAEGVEALIDAALASRPDLAARVEDVRAQEARAREAEADLYPELYAQGAYGLDAWWYQFSAPPTVRSNTPVWNAGLGLRWSLFEGFERLNAIREAEAEAAAARASLEEAELEAVAAVWRAYHDQRAAAKKYEYAGALLAASREAYQSNLESYHRGLATIVDLLTAEGDLAESRYLVVQSRADLLTQAARIAYVAGTVRSSPAPLP